VVLWDAIGIDATGAGFAILALRHGRNGVFSYFRPSFACGHRPTWGLFGVGIPRPFTLSCGHGWYSVSQPRAGMSSPSRLIPAHLNTSPPTETGNARRGGRNVRGPRCPTQGLQYPFGEDLGPLAPPICLTSRCRNDFLARRMVMCPGKQFAPLGMS
jgi:hypothetical protein